MFADILSSLACEHDISANDDIEEYDSDDSQSLFTGIKPVKNQPKIVENSASVRHQTKLEERRGTEIYRSSSTVMDMDQMHNSKQNETKSASKTTNCAELNVMDRDDDSDRHTEKVESGGQEKMVDDSDPESDESQSSPPATRASVREKAAQLVAQKDRVSNLQSRANLKEAGKKMETNELGDMGKLDYSAVSHLKNQFNHSKLSLPRNRNDETPGNVFKARKYRYSMQDVTSPITPLMSRTNFSPNVESAQNTSSPVVNMPLDFPGHIRSGTSPLSPGYNESFTVLSETDVSSHSNTRQTTSSSRFLGDRKNRLSGLDDINEPMNNESIQSQWSDIDQSEYLQLGDETQYQALEVKNPEAVSGINDSQRLQSNKHTPTSNDMSTNSQWSEVDDEQYLTLDLEDIKNMTYDNHTTNTGNVGSPVTDDYNAVVGDSAMNINETNTINKRRISENSMYRDHQKSPEIYNPDSPPSPSVLETPPKKHVRKPVQSPSRKRGLDVVGPDDASNVSPIKRSLAKLQFM